MKAQDFKDEMELGTESDLFKKLVECLKTNKPA
jgi:hypothetical protein